MNTKDLTIGVLSITATILFVGVLLISTQPPAVMAAGMTASSGDYTMTVGSINTNEDLLYVIDSPKERMIVYYFDSRTKKIMVAEGHNLAEMRQQSSGGGATGSGPQPPPGAGSRGSGNRP